MDGRSKSWAVGLVLGAGAAGPVMGQWYQAVPLGSLGGSAGAVALGINGVGDVVGQSDTSGGVPHAFFWRAGVMADLGALVAGQPSRALSVNTAGLVVGTAKNASGQDRAVKWERDGLGVWHITDLGTLAGGTFAIANRVSENGIIVGRSGVGNGRYHGFILSGGVMTDVGVLSYPSNTGYSEALGVNADGKATGYAYAPLWGPDHAWYYDSGGATDITPPGQFSFARGYAINASGVVGGTTILPGGGSSGFEAAIYTPGVGWTEIGVIAGLTESEGYDINDSGQVVGRSFDLAINDSRGFVYRSGQMIDLNATTNGAPARIVEACAISSSGWIAATADGVAFYALLLAPAEPCYANCDGSSTAPILNVNDFVCFQSRYAAGEPYANCDNSTTEPVLNVNDFICFQQKFAAGCP